MIPLPQSTARTSTGLMRALFGLITTSAGWILLGIGLLVGGLAWGLTSHQVSYVAGNRGVYDVFVDSGVVYFQQEQTSNYYVIHTPDFSPQIDGVIEDSSLTYAPGQFSFIARTDTVHVNYSGYHFNKIINFAHPIEKITFNGTVFTSDEYQAFPNGYPINTWPYAGPLMGIGAVSVGLPLFFLARTRKRQQMVRAADLAALEAMPSPFARELAEETLQSSD